MENPCLIVGLGNPGAEYASTRHNIGFQIVETLAQRWQIAWKTESGWNGLVAKTSAGAFLLKPLTYMNRSGNSVQTVSHFYKIPPSRLLVIVDDLALPLGKLRLRATGSAGGHNGIQSIIDRMGTADFARLRVGIGSASGSMVSHVLGKFRPEERTEVEIAIQTAVDAVECTLRSGLTAAMNQFNTSNSKKSEGKQS